MQNDARTVQVDSHKIRTVCSGDVPPKNENPGALAGATGADFEASNFSDERYIAEPSAAMPFDPMAQAAAQRVLHLVHRYGLTVERAAMAVPLIYGEVTHG